MVQAPIFHVNGDDPEACVRVARLAFAYRQAFHKDVVIDMVCYRRHGHNEGDDPSYTQPLMYKRIDARRSVRKLYTEALVKRGDITLEEAEAALDDFQSRLQAALDETRTPRPPEGIGAGRRRRRSGVLPHVETGVDRERRSTRSSPRSTPSPRASPSTPSWPSSSRPAPRCSHDGEVDWALAEALAFGSLLLEGTVGAPRRPGHPARHVLATATPCSSTTRPAPSTRRSPTLGADQAPSSGSTTRCCREYAALGFEYGYSVVNKDALVIWEAQFGDFVNGAQIIIDQFLVAAEDKWGQTSGLVMLLPHGYEGQGPEHSSARIERFLTLCRRGQHPGLQRHHRGAVLPPAAPPGAARRAQAAGRVHAEVAAAGQGVAVADRRRSTHGLVPGGARRPGRHRRRRRARGSCSPRARSAYEALDAPRRAAARRWPSSASSSSTRGPYDARGRRARAATRTPTEIVWLQEEPENMGPWNFIKGRLYEASTSTPLRSTG